MTNTILIIPTQAGTEGISHLTIYSLILLHSHFNRSFLYPSTPHANIAFISPRFYSNIKYFKLFMGLIWRLKYFSCKACSIASSIIHTNSLLLLITVCPFNQRRSNHLKLLYYYRQGTATSTSIIEFTCYRWEYSVLKAFSDWSCSGWSQANSVFVG